MKRTYFFNLLKMKMLSIRLIISVFCSLSGSLQKCSVQSRVFMDYVIITGIKFMLSLPIL